MRSFHPATVVGLIGSGIVAAGLFVIGTYVLAVSSLPLMFGLVVTTAGAISGALVFAAARRHRKSWAFLIATWIVFGFCGFFTAPKVLDLPKVQPAWKLPKQSGTLDANTLVKLKVLAVCLGFAAPFAFACTSFAIGRRDYERAA